MTEHPAGHFVKQLSLYYWEAWLTSMESPDLWSGLTILTVLREAC